MGKIYEEMRKSEHALFGDGTHYVRKDDMGWVIEARSRDFDKEPYKETLAYKADFTYDPEYRTALLKWANDYGYSSRPLAEIYDLYNQQMEDIDTAIAKSILIKHRDAPEYWELVDFADERDRHLAIALRDYYLDYAESHGIILTNEDVHPEGHVTPMEVVSLAKESKKSRGVSRKKKQ